VRRLVREREKAVAEESGEEELSNKLEGVLGRNGQNEPEIETARLRRVEESLETPEGFSYRGGNEGGEEAWARKKRGWIKRGGLKITGSQP